jgi:Uma2 family endonuclease
MIMELSLDLNKRYTYADYLIWQDDNRRELMNGFIRVIPPSMKMHCQRLTGNLFGELRNVIKKHNSKCEIFFTPFDVRLSKNGEKENNRIDTVLQPDICIVCDPSKIDNNGCLGAPDFIAEIYLAATARYMFTEKFDLYEALGVREYWVVFPFEAVQVFLLQSDGKYDEGTLYETGKIPVHIFDGVEIDLQDIGIL